MTVINKTVLKKCFPLFNKPYNNIGVNKSTRKMVLRMPFLVPSNMVLIVY